MRAAAGSPRRPCFAEDGSRRRARRGAPHTIAACATPRPSPPRTLHPPAAAEPPASPAVPGGRALFAAAAGPWEPPGAPGRAR